MTLFVLAVAAAVLFYVFVQPRAQAAPTFMVTSDDLPKIIELLRAAPEESFADLLFRPPEADPKEDPAFIQYSIEQGQLGFDWVLTSSRNEGDCDAIRAFIARQHLSVSDRELNQVRYLRVEGPGCESLGRKILNEFYRIPRDAPLEMITEGFDWKP
ncbi:MAG TPA: hypothetical protein VMR50_15230 [Myxococcota bacterium]|nr:hypothetical protein [Myxococcota bacterium]